MGKIDNVIFSRHGLKNLELFFINCCPYDTKQAIHAESQVHFSQQASEHDDNATSWKRHQPTINCHL